MSRKEIYREQGKRVRSRPRKSFYQKVSFWLIVSFLTIFVIVAISIFLKKEDIPDEKSTLKDTELEDVENETSDKVIVDEQTYTYEDFKGTYVTFEGEAYNSPVNYLFELQDDLILEGEMESGLLTREVVNYHIEGHILTIDWNEVETDNGMFPESSNRTLQLKLDYQGSKKSISFIDSNDSRLYSMTNEDLQNHYNQLEIDYARIIMMTGIPRIDPIEPIIFVKKHSVGNPIFRVDGSATFPENVTILSSPNNSFSNHDVTMIAYSTQGDGNITIYPYPTDFKIDTEAETDDDYRRLSQEVIDNAYSTYVDPSEPYLVSDFINNVEFIYE